MSNNTQKKVSVLIPCRNEVESIENCINNVFSFEPPDGGFEVIVIDGMSDDGTREKLNELKRRYPELKVIDNPMKTIPHAMNLGIKHANGKYIIRTDVRCVHPRTYLVDLLKLKEETRADNVGGVLEPVGKTYIQKSIALSYKSPIAMGGALRDRGNFTGETDAVYGGCFEKKRLIEIGLYDENMIKNEDDELSFRLRKNGGKVVQSGNIRVQYYPRKRFSHLFKQFMHYGYWKVPVLKKHPRQASIRHIAPTMLVLSFVFLAIASLFNKLAFKGLVFLSAIYFSSVVFESIRVSMKSGLKYLPGVIISMIMIHFGYGIGFFISFLAQLFNIKLKWFEGLSR